MWCQLWLLMLFAPGLAMGPVALSHWQRPSATWTVENCDDRNQAHLGVSVIVSVIIVAAPKAFERGHRCCLAPRGCHKVAQNWTRPRTQWVKSGQPAFNVSGMDTTEQLERPELTFKLILPERIVCCRV